MIMESGPSAPDENRTFIIAICHMISLLSRDNPDVASRCGHMPSLSMRLPQDPSL